MAQATIQRAGKVQLAAFTGGLPKIKGLLTQTYSNDRFSIGFNERFTGKYQRVTTEFVGDDTIRYSPNRTYVDMDVTYSILDRDRVQLFLNVQNLFDTDPPVIPNFTAANIAAPVDRSVYDVVGRQFTIGARARF